MGSRYIKQESEPVAEKSTREGCARSQNKIQKINLRVPPIPPTDSIASNICKVRYFLEVNFEYDFNVQSQE